MKKIILSTLLLLGSVSLMANKNISATNSDVTQLKTIDGRALYAQHCTVCHGDKAQKTPLTRMVAIAGRDTTRLARMTRAYRDQAESHGTAHSMNLESQVMQEATSSLSNQQIGAIAKYINSLKK